VSISRPTALRRDEKPAPERDAFSVTRMPNISAAFPEQAYGLRDGETLISIKPDGRGDTEPVAKNPMRIGAEQYYRTLGHFEPTVGPCDLRVIYEVRLNHRNRCTSRVGLLGPEQLHNHWER